MSTAVTKQGDHIFNFLETPILRPFDTIKSLRSAYVDGEHFVQDYLLHSYSLTRQVAEKPVLVEARKYSASAGAEEDALRELAALRPKYPSLARLNAALLREIHLRNSDEFGDAATRYEIELLSAVGEALEAAFAAPAAPAGRPVRTASPGIAYQQMFNAAYDPAAALVVIVTSMARETASAQGVFHPLIAAIAETLDRPGMWREAYAGYREDRHTKTGEIITSIREVLTSLEVLKAQGVMMGTYVKNELAQKSRAQQGQDDYGAMLHLIHTWLQQMR